MKSSFHSNLAVTMLLLLVLMTATVACAGEPASGNSPDSGSMLTAESNPVAEMAGDIATNAGKVASAAAGTRQNRSIVVFEETHDSRLGQIEIALMLLRLHNRYEMSRISLEGAMAADGPLPTEWFRDLTNSESAWQSGIEVATHLLRSGEISGAEFIALTLPEVTVVGSEKSEEYSVDLAGGASSAGFAYLFSMAKESLSQSEIRRANELIGDGKEKEAVELIMASDPWISERYSKISSDEVILSAEEMADLLREIRDQAAKRRVSISKEDSSGMANLIQFFEMAVQRNGTMMHNTLMLADQVPSRPVGMVIGAAHTTGMTRLLQDAGASFAIISPESLASHTDWGKIDHETYDRKRSRQSVDPQGYLGAILDGRGKKPPTVLGEQWFQSKTAIWIATDLIAKAVANGEEPPFAGLDEQLRGFDSIRIHRDSFGFVEKNGQKRVVFKVTARTADDDPKETVDLWVGGWSEPPGPPSGEDQLTDTGPNPDKRPSVSIERLVEKMLEETRAEEERRQKGKEMTGKETTSGSVAVALLSITEDTKAVFSTKSTAVRETLEAG